MFDTEELRRDGRFIGREFGADELERRVLRAAAHIAEQDRRVAEVLAAIDRIRIVQTIAPPLVSRESLDEVLNGIEKILLS